MAKKYKDKKYREDKKKSSDMCFNVALQTEDREGKTTPEAENWLRRALNALK